MRKRKIKASLKPALGLVAFFAAIFILIVFLGLSARKSDFFKVKGVIIRQSQIKGSLLALAVPQPPVKIDLSYLVGRNIFTIDLESEEKRLSLMYPGWRQIKLTRIMPNWLHANFLQRRPAACVKLYRNFFLDDQGVIFGPGAMDCAQTKLPLVFGLEGKVFAPRPGNKYNVKEVILALDIIKFMQQNRALKELPIISINVYDAANASFVIGHSQDMNMEVKIGQGYINDKVNILASVLAQAKNDLDKIKYIDLRFKEPVIKFTDAKKK